LNKRVGADLFTGSAPDASFSRPASRLTVPTAILVRADEVIE
jgi:hypothetical protein